MEKIYVCRFLINGEKNTLFKKFDTPNFVTISKCFREMLRDIFNKDFKKVEIISIGRA